MRSIVTTAFLVLASLSCAEIDYDVKVNAEAKQLHVTISIPNPDSSDVLLQSPNWAPGSYRLSDNYKNVLNLKATDGAGAALNVTQDSYTWKVTGAPQVKVEYDLAIGGGRFSSTDASYHWSGPSTYLYVVGRKDEACKLTVQSPKGEPAYCGLDETAKNTFVASDYDVLADNPVSTGDLWLREYKVLGKNHQIVMRGEPRARMDLEKLVKACRYATETQAHFYGGLPYNKYVWHFAVTEGADGGGGLEHLSSTQITLANGLGNGVVGVLAHEFFHLWNVKRIRSSVLGPFDYTQLPSTGALWWLEGVTDYFAHTFMYRYGWWDRETYYRDVVQNYTRNRGYAQHADISLYDSGFRVKEASNGRGNSQGLGMSYYDGGWVAGLILDIELRVRTENKKSLDDVQLELWRRFQANPAKGFEEGEIRDILQEVGGFTMGQFYDDLIRKPNAKPVAEALAKIGIKMEEVDQKSVVLGFLTLNRSNDGAVVNSAPKDSVLKDDDIITAIDEVSLNLPSTRAIGSAMTGYLTKCKAGQVVKLSVKRGTESLKLDWTLQETTRKAMRAFDDPNATPDKVKLREGFLKRIPGFVN